MRHPTSGSPERIWGIESEYESGKPFLKPAHVWVEFEQDDKVYVVDGSAGSAYTLPR